MPASGQGVKSWIVMAVALAVSAPATTVAAETGISVGDAWIRMIVPSRPAAGYFTLHNNADVPKLLVGASSPGCSALMLHQSRSESGLDQMESVKSVPVPAHGSLAFSPGGYHLMCMHPSSAVRPGASVPVTMKFGDGGTLTEDFRVTGTTGK